ncbi:MAG: flagellar protein [Firmicutes bacterium]|jgi:flagellar operon protein|nr:flagellar protein [Bacillota bacterium]
MVNRVTPHLPGSAPAGKAGGASGKAAPGKKEALSFHEVLEQVQRPPLVFSAHARARMESRNIDLQEEDLRKITAAMEKARAKGARSSLLLYGEIALLASVTNRTIITAVDGAAEGEQIFTGIDSAVIVK